jgi:hypothetical protein
MSSTAGASCGEPVSGPGRIAVRAEREKHRSKRQVQRTCTSHNEKGKTPAPIALATIKAVFIQASSAERTVEVTLST